MTRDVEELIRAYDASKRDIFRENTVTAIRASYGQEMIDVLEDFLTSAEKEVDLVRAYTTMQGLIMLNITHPHLKLTMGLLQERQTDARLRKIKGMLTDVLNQNDPRTKLALRKMMNYEGRREFMKQYAPEILELI